MHVFAIASLSLDGYINPPAGHVASTSWTSEEDKRFFIDRTKEAGVIVVGMTTFLTYPTKPQPKKVNIVMTSKGGAPFVGLTKKTGEPRISLDLEHAPAGLLDPTIIYYTRLSPAEVVLQVVAHGHSELAVSGGASIYRAFMEAGVLETLYLTYEPILFGGGVSFLGGNKKNNADNFDPGLVEGSTFGGAGGSRWKLKSVRQLNEQGSFLAEYTQLEVDAP